MQTQILFALLATCACACTATIVADKRHQTLWHAVAKIIASATFVCGVFWMPAYNTPYGHQIAWAACLGMLGDVLILHPSRCSFLAALLVFLCGHMLYIGAFAHLGVHAIDAAFACLLLGGMGVVVRTWLWPHLVPKMRFFVAAYLVTISTMVVCAWASCRYSILPYRQVAGACCFYLSDLTVARQAFVKASWRNSLVGLPLYYSAQWLLIGTLGFP